MYASGATTYRNEIFLSLFSTKGRLWDFEKCNNAKKKKQKTKRLTGLICCILNNNNPQNGSVATRDPKATTPRRKNNFNQWQHMPTRNYCTSNGIIYWPAQQPRLFHISRENDTQKMDFCHPHQSGGGGRDKNCPVSHSSACGVEGGWGGVSATR